jgi:hypothetical protein
MRGQCTIFLQRNAVGIQYHEAVGESQNVFVVTALKDHALLQTARDAFFALADRLEVAVIRTLLSS